MKRILYILLFILPLSIHGQTVINSYVYVTGSSGYCGDADADAYLTAVAAFVTPTSTQINAVCSLVASSKASANTWGEMIGMYPLIWSNASADAINLKNPGTYNLTFFGSPTHTSSGIDWNGTSQYANTGIAANTMGQNDNHIAVYVQESNTTDAYDIGASGSVTLAIRIRSTPLRLYNNSSFTALTFAYTGTQGMFLGTRTASTTTKMFKNGGQLGSTNTTASNGSEANNIWLAALNNGGTPSLYSPRKASYYQVGYGMSDAQVAENYTNIQAFHTTLGIQQ